MVEKLSRRRSLVWIAGLLIIAAAAFARFETIRTRPLWSDEEITVRVATHARSLAAVWRVAQLDKSEHPPLHYALVYLTIDPGDPLLTSRLPAAVAGVASIAFLMLAAQRIFGVREALVAGALVCLLPYHIDYSQEARAYAVLVCLVVAQLWLFTLLLERPLLSERARPWAAALFVVTGALATYAHHTSLFFELSLGLALAASLTRETWLHGWTILRAPPQRARLALLACLAAVALLYLPQAGNTLAFLGGREDFTPEWTLRPSLRFWGDLVARWAGTGQGILQLVIAGCFAIGVGAAVLQRGRVLVIWLLMPVAVMSLLPFSKFFDLRFLMVSLPAFVLILARGIVVASDAAARAVGHMQLGERRRALVANGAIATLCGAVVLGHAIVYPTFRTLSQKCSQFYRAPALMEMHRGFCREYIILNSIHDEHAYLLRRVRH